MSLRGILGTFVNLDEVSTEQKTTEEKPKGDSPVFFPKSDSASNTSSTFTNTANSQATTFPPTTINSPQCEPHIDKILEKYEQGFNSLNLPGYDFFEFFKSVSQIDPNNPQVYDIALKMAQSMDASVTKEKLSEQASFYIKEIEKVYNTFSVDGKNKKESILRDKDTESASLDLDIDNLEKTIEQAKKDLEAKKNLKGELDNKYKEPIGEIDCKLMANDLAKDKLVKSIELVKTNLNK